MKGNMEKRIRLRGFAEANGIGLEAGIDTGRDAIGNMGKIVTVNAEGELNCRDYNFVENSPNMIKAIHKWGRIFKIISFIIAAVCMVGYILNFADNYFAFSMAYIFMGFGIASEAVIIALGRFLGVDDMISFSKFQAAKNAVMNFYDNNQRIPSVEELRNSQRTLRHPEFVNSAGLASTLIVLGAARLLPGFAFLIAAIVWFLFCVTVEPSFSQRAWQYFAVTSKPEKIHYETAITALEEAVKWTKNATVKFTKQKFSKKDFEAKMGHMFKEEKCVKCRHYKECKELWESLTDEDFEISICEVRMIDEGKEE